MSLVLLSSTGFAKTSIKNTDNQPASGPVLRVGCIPAPPFVIIEENNHITGIAVHIWEKIAQKLNLSYALTPVSIDINQEVDALAKHKMDVLIGPIAPSYVRTKLADFTQPYFISSVAIVIKKGSNFWLLIYDSMKKIVGPVFLGFLLFLAVYINLFWFFEYKQKTHLPKTYWAGVAHMFWVSVLRLRVEMPMSAGGRILHFIWIAFGAVLLSTIFSTMTSSMTLAKNAGHPINSIDDLSKLRLVAIQGTYPVSVAEANELIIDIVSTRKEGMDKLLNNEADGLLDYQYVASYYIKQAHLLEKLTISSFPLKNDLYSFALPYNSTLRETLNLEISKLYDSDMLRKVCRNFLQKKDSEHCN
jgi:polar amino acid transport system substrate-binding protein